MKLNLKKLLRKKEMKDDLCPCSTKYLAEINDHTYLYDDKNAMISAVSTFAEGNVIFRLNCYKIELYELLN